MCAGIPIVAFFLWYQRHFSLWWSFSRVFASPRVQYVRIPLKRVFLFSDLRFLSLWVLDLLIFRKKNVGVQEETAYEPSGRPKILRSFQSPGSNDVVWSTPVVARRVARAPKHASKSAASTSNWCWDENSCKPQRRGQTIRVFQIHLTSVFYFSFFFFFLLTLFPCPSIAICTGNATLRCFF
ncbi:hypothetical protein VNO80_09175 [Phaseolus coccineus]|uniref:Transmembrane protein n=1 Tax=Phaseolus coccineus TaxID=3886 RepID=A0AAN9N7H3_PHACN